MRLLIGIYFPSSFVVVPNWMVLEVNPYILGFVAANRVIPVNKRNHPFLLPYSLNGSCGCTENECMNGWWGWSRNLSVRNPLPSRWHTPMEKQLIFLTYAAFLCVFQYCIDGLIKFPITLIRMMLRHSIFVLSAKVLCLLPADCGGFYIIF